ncbi:MAG: TraR/DksA C4-type zinc finger protein [Chloroflexi bacterium]|nr:TraR/DksA C4-type zinc finger protein [Chloroflexota bacterium]
MNTDFLVQVRTYLLNDEQQTLQSLVQLDERAREAQHPDEIVPMFSELVVDEAMLISDRERDLAARRTLMRSLEEVRHALQRLEEGTYGLCALCGKPIPERRLLARPQSTLCVTCQSYSERRG